VSSIQSIIYRDLAWIDGQLHLFIHRQWTPIRTRSRLEAARADNPPPAPADWSESWQAAFDKGESSAHADWMYALNQEMDLSIGDHDPIAVAQAIHEVISAFQMEAIQKILDEAAEADLEDEE
jgi:hypothetical protein